MADPNLKQWATERQSEIIDAVIQHGSNRKAAVAMGVHPSCIDQAMGAVKAKAARAGYAPGHDMTRTVPDGFKVRGVSTYYDKEGEVRGQWVKSAADEERRAELLLAAVEAACATIPRLAPIAPPLHTVDGLLTQYTFTDYHLGMRAWAEEGGADWDLAIAEDLLTRCFEYLATAAPRSKVGLICQLGDFMHFDSLTPVTPTSRHVVDAAGHYQEIVRVAIRCLRRLVDFALTQHARVVILAAEGNHDIASSVWMRELLKTLYENEPRVEVMDSPNPYYAFQWGHTMLAFSHGHLRKKESLSQYFAAAFSKMWGETRYRYGSSGHYHHEVTVKEEPGMKWRQFPTLAPNDSHSARGAYCSQRLALATTYSDRTGFAGEIGVGPDMLADQLAA
jgi:hypothetical protein